MIKKFWSNFNIQQNILLKTDKKTLIWSLSSVIAIIVMISSAFLQVAFQAQARLFANLFFICLYFLVFSFIWLCIRDSIKKISFTKRQWIVSLLLCTAIFVVVGAFLYTFLAQEKTIKVWDAKVYWSKLVQIIGNFYNNIPDAIKTLFNTFSGEYSDLAAVLFAPLGVYLGTLFERYSIFVFIIYLAPSCLLLSMYLVRVYTKISGKLAKPWYLIMSTAVCAFSVPLLHPVLLGRVDIAGVVIVMIMAHIALDWDWEKFSLKSNLLLAILSLALLLTRRWYAFYIVGFYFAFGVEYIWKCIAQKKLDGKLLIKLLKNLVFIAGICTLFLVVFTPGTLKMFLGNNYSKEYSFYKMRSDFGDIIYLAKNFGFVLFGLSIFGYVVMLINKATRQIAVRWLVTSVVAFVLFERIQSLGKQHCYLFIPAVLLGICFAIVFISQQLKSVKGGALACAVAAFCAFNTAVSFVPAFKIITVGRGTVFSQVQEYPEIRHDVEQIKSLVKSVNTYTAESFDKAYAIGNTSSFSQEVLKNALMPNIIDATPNILEGSIVDLRDGFPSQAFLANYILIEDYLKPPKILDNVLTGSQVVFKLHDMFIESPSVEEFYTLAHSEQTDDASLKILQKTKPLTKDFVDEFSNTLKKGYPEDPFVYEPNYFWALANINTDINYDYFVWLNGIYLVPTNNTSLSWQLSGQFNTMQFDIVNWNENLSYQVNIDGKPSSTEMLKLDTQTIIIDVANAQNVEIIFNSNIEAVNVVTINNASLK